MSGNAPKLLLICVSLLFVVCARGQGRTHYDKVTLNRLDNLRSINDTLYVLSGLCGNKVFVSIPSLNDGNATSATKVTQFSNVIKRPSLLSVHGNILYDVNYRSLVDTPYAESDIYQHTVQTYLDIVVKDKYPLRLYFTTRMGNSNLFRNFSDINLGFNANDFKERVKQRVLGNLSKPAEMDSLMALRNSLDQDYAELNTLKKSMKRPAFLQKAVEEKERELYGDKRSEKALPPTKGAMGALDKKEIYEVVKKLLKEKKISPKGIAIPEDNEEVIKKKNTEGELRAEYASAMDNYNSQKKKADSLQSEITQKEGQYAKAKAKYADVSEKVGALMDGAKDPKQLIGGLKGMDLPDSTLPKGYKTLLAVRSFGIGRTILDYSELSVKNVSITGVQLEYNPSYYMAFATGYVDYRFRDYIVRDKSVPKQYVSLVRFGKGMRDGNNIILTYYTGKRQLFNSSTTPNVGTIPNYNLMGYTLETKYYLNKTNYMVAEVAKSSLPYYSLAREKSGTFSSAFDMKDRSNEAYSVKLVSYFQHTMTRLNATYSRIGANFQSFSVFTSGSRRVAWSVRVDQPLFKKVLTLTGSLRVNDFANPYLGTSYSSSTVFKSVQATFRKRRWPVMSVGYFPSSQLTKLGDGQYNENLFYTLTGTANHFYKLRRTLLNSSLVYTQFYNKAADSSFVYFSTKNILLSQSVFLDKLTLQCNLSGAFNTQYELYTIEGQAQYKLRDWLSVGGGLKYNMQTVYDKRLWGYSGNSTIRVPKIGEFQFMVDKGFIPGAKNNLTGNTIGRMSYFKIF